MNATPAPFPSAAPATPRLGKGTAVAIAALLTVALSAVRLRLFRKLHFCGTPDACFYLGMAQNLAGGHGFTAHFLYDFQQAHPSLPNTGLEYWRPGISLLLAALKPFGAVTLFGSIVITTLVGVLFSAAAWHAAFHATRSRALALGSFALCLVSSSVWIGSATPDSGLYYGAAVAWFLALFTVRRQGLVPDLLAMVCVGIAYLIRNDAALLLLPLLTVLWLRRSASSAGTQRKSGQAPAQGSWSYAALMVAAFVVALVPMHWLYRAVLGTAFPAGAAQTLYFTDLSDFGRYGDPVSRHTLLAHGLVPLLRLRITTFFAILYRVAALMIGYPSLILLAGLVASSRQRAWNESSPDPRAADNPSLHVTCDFAGPLGFATAALAAYTLVLPAVGAFAALRTAVGLMPLVSVLVMVAIQRISRTPTVAVGIAAALIAAETVSGFMDARRDIAASNSIADGIHAEATAVSTLDGSPGRSVILTNDPVQFSVTTGFATVALPSNGLDAIAAAARDFGVTHAILDSENLPVPLETLKHRLHPVRSLFVEQEHALVLELPGRPTKP